MAEPKKDWKELLMTFAAGSMIELDATLPEDEQITQAIYGLHSTIEILHGVETPIVRIHPDNRIQFANNPFLEYAEVIGVETEEAMPLRTRRHNSDITEIILPSHRPRFEAAKEAARARYAEKDEMGILKYLIAETTEFTFVFVSYSGTQSIQQTSITYSKLFDAFQISFTNVTALQGDHRHVEPKRFWQWNRYTPVVSSNAAMRDGDWKLVRPRIPETMQIKEAGNLERSMYHPEEFIENGVMPVPEHPPLSPPPPPELYNIADDPLEATDLADTHPKRVSKMLLELETWFEEVEAERATIEDQW